MSLNGLQITDLAAKGLEYGFASESRLIQTLSTRFSEEYVSKKIDVGETINITLKPRPNPWIEGRSINPQGTVYDTVAATVLWKNTSRIISHPELTVSAKDFFRDVVTPDIRGGVREAERRMFEIIMTGPTMANTAYVGTDPANSRVWMDTRAKYRKMLGPDRDIYGCIDPLTLAALSDNESKIFGPEKLRDEAATNMKIRPMAGVGEFYDSVDLPTHTNGSAVHTGAATVAGANQTGNTLNIANAGNTKTYTKGSQFYFSASGQGAALDPEKKFALAFPQVFTLTEDVETSSGGLATLTFSPPIIITGSLKNQLAAPTDTTAVKFLGDVSKTYQQNLLYTGEAIEFIGLRMPDLEGQGGVVKNAKYKEVTMRSVYFTSWQDGQSYLRYDQYTGGVVTYPQHVWRLWGKALS
jgi:hypothetical protein